MDAHPGGEGRLGFTLRVPRGVIAAITPFNFPVNLACHKIGPAIGSGNTVVLKPASATPRTAYMLAEVFARAGLPEGCLNVVSGTGDEIGDALVTHPDVAMVTFTGSAAVGKNIRSIAGLKMVTLELGGNCALIVDGDADLDLAVTRSAAGAYAHSGQVCIHTQRIYVGSDIHQSFVDKLASAADDLTIGDPREDETKVSSLLTPTEADRVAEWIDEAAQAGATVVTGGKRVGHATLTPALLTGVGPDVKVSCREVFGPVVHVEAFADLDEAIRCVNASDLGLQAGVFSRDIGRALRAARKIECGGVMINEAPTFRVDQMPYGGVKDSGSGREGPKYAMEEMTEPRMITVRL